MLRSVDRSFFLGLAALPLACGPPPAAPPPPSVPAPSAVAAPPPTPAPRSYWTDGPTLVTGDRLLVYDLQRGHLRASLRDPDGVPPARVTVAPDAAHLIVVGTDGTLTVWRVADGALVLRRRDWTDACAFDPADPDQSCGPLACLFYLTWSPSGKTAVLTGARDIHLLDLAAGTLQPLSCEDPDCGVYALSGEVLALDTGEAAGVLVVRPPALTPLLRVAPGRGGLLDATGRLLAVNHGNPGFDAVADAALWDVPTGRRLWQSADTNLWSFDPRGRFLLGLHHVAQKGRSNVVVDARTGAVRARWAPSFTTCGGGVAWGRDGVAVSDDWGIQIWREGRGLQSLGAPLSNRPGEDPRLVTSCESCGGDLLRLSPDGETLASPRRLWSFRTGREIARLDWSCQGAAHVGWADDGRLLALDGTFEGQHRLVVFRAADGKVAAERAAPTCGADWIRGSHALSIRPAPSVLAWEVLRADDRARLWLLPSADGGIAAVSSAGDHDGTPQAGTLPEGAALRRACTGLVERFVAGKPCP